MNSSEDLAARLRQAVQGCTLHIHGPVQAWAAIIEEDDLNPGSIDGVRFVIEQVHNARLEELNATDPRDDVAVRKEILTYHFIDGLLRGSKRDGD